VVDGEYDHLPEAAFYMVGGIDQAVEKAKKLAEDERKRKWAALEAQHKL